VNGDALTTETQQNRSSKVGLALALAVAAISFAAIFFRKAAPTHELVSACLRLLFAAAVLSPMAIHAFRSGRVSRRLVRLACLAGVFYAAHFGTWVASLGRTTIAASVTLVTATPLLLGIASLISGRDRLQKRHWMAIGLALVGVITIGGTDFGTGWRALWGDALALMGAAAMAGYLLVGRRLGDEMNVWAFTAIAAAVGGVLLLLTCVCLGVGVRAASNEALFYLLLAALVPQLIGHTLLTWALRYTRPAIVGIATVGEPVGATLLGWFWLGESVPLGIAIGCSITVMAVILGVWRSRGVGDG
jgi:drug/metabolite transporter (DMT)-like permease